MRGQQEQSEGVGLHEGLCCAGAQQHWALPLLGTKLPWEKHLPELLGSSQIPHKKPCALRMRSKPPSLRIAVAKVITPDPG